MIVKDEAAARRALAHLNYYRLTAYWLPFESDHASHTFRSGTSFEHVLELYEFDRELRLLVLDGIERIEVSVRAHWAHHFASQRGPHAHLDVRNAASAMGWWENVIATVRQVKRSREPFIRHLTATYEEALPPTWAVAEVISLSLLSRWYGNLSPKPVRRAISSAYGLDEDLLESWLHALSVVRNICAHHARLWNREFTVLPGLPKSKPFGLREQFHPGSRKLYNFLVLEAHLLEQIVPEGEWSRRVVELMQRYSIEAKGLGFPDGWEEFPIWRERGVME